MSELAHPPELGSVSESQKKWLTKPFLPPQTCMQHQDLEVVFSFVKIVFAFLTSAVKASELIDNSDALPLILVSSETLSTFAPNTVSDPGFPCGTIPEGFILLAVREVEPPGIVQSAFLHAVHCCSTHLPSSSS